MVVEKNKMRLLEAELKGKETLERSHGETLYVLKPK